MCYVCLQGDSRSVCFWVACGLDKIAKVAQEAAAVLTSTENKKKHIGWVTKVTRYHWWHGFRAFSILKKRPFIWCFNPPRNLWSVQKKPHNWITETQANATNHWNHTFAPDICAASQSPTFKLYVSGNSLRLHQRTFSTVFVCSQVTPAPSNGFLKRNSVTFRQYLDLLRTRLPCHRVRSCESSKAHDTDTCWHPVL